MVPRPIKQGETGIEEIDRLRSLSAISLEDYLVAASRYVRDSPLLDASQKKTGQILLSQSLGRVLYRDLTDQLPGLGDVVVGERVVGGALRTVKADVSEVHPTDGLRLAVEIKPVNLAVGRAIWNRFGDIRTFAVNLHLKFPFAVVGGVLAVPSYEWTSPRQVPGADGEAEAQELGMPASRLAKKPTEPLVRRAIARLVRAGGRRTEGDAPHLLEAIAVVFYDPVTATLSDHLPPSSSRLRWHEFVSDLARAYEAPFE